MGTQTLDRIAARLIYPIRCVSTETNQILNTELLQLAEDEHVKQGFESSEPGPTPAPMQQPKANKTVQTLPADHQLNKDVEVNNNIDGQPSAQNSCELQTRPTIKAPYASNGRIAEQRHNLVSQQRPVAESVMPDPSSLRRIETQYSLVGMTRQQNHDTDKSALAGQPEDFKDYSNRGEETAVVKEKIAISSPSSSPEYTAHYDELMNHASSSLSHSDFPSIAESSPVRSSEFFSQTVVPAVNNVAANTASAETRMRASTTKTMQLKSRSIATNDSPVDPINPPAEIGDLNWAGTAQESPHLVKQPDSVNQHLPGSIASAFEYAQQINQQQTENASSPANSRIENNFNLNLTMAEDAQTQNREHLKEMLLKILLDSARQQGLDV